jgi:hypothetical protein
LRSYAISGVLLLMLVSLIVSRTLTSLAPAAAAHVTISPSSDGSAAVAGLHAHGGGVDTEGDQLSDGLPEWVPTPEGQSSPRLATLLADGETVPAGRDIEPLPLPPRG